MTNRDIPLDGTIIPSEGDTVKTLQQTIADVARHKTMAEHIQCALADYYSRQGKTDKAHWLPLCGSWLHWRVYTDPDNTAQLMAANYCHHALCPMCAWRRHARNGAIISRALEGMDKLYMVTLTVDNTPTVTREQLQHLIRQSTAMLRSLQCPDYIANIEITYSDNKGYHPHVHAIVRQPYWTDRSIRYSMADWRRRWGKLAGGTLGYNIMHIAPIDDTAASVAEVTKYLCKPLTDVDNLQSVIDTLIPAIRRVRQIRAGGEIRRRIAAVKQQDIIDSATDMAELMRYDWCTVVSQWIDGGYVSYIPSRDGVEICAADRQANTTQP